MYYLRTRPAADPIQFTINNQEVSAIMANGFKKSLSFAGKTGESEDEESAKAELFVKQAYQKNLEAISCSLNNPEACVSCSG